MPGLGPLPAKLAFPKTAWSFYGPSGDLIDPEYEDPYDSEQ